MQIFVEVPLKAVPSKLIIYLNKLDFFIIKSIIELTLLIFRYTIDTSKINYIEKNI